MSDIVKLLIELGASGLMIGLAGWIIYTYVKNVGASKQVDDSFKKSVNDDLNEIKTSIKSIDSRVTNLETGMATNPHISTPVKPSHPKQFLDRLKLGPQLHKTLSNFRARINADHIFIGSFHNGNESITGIPYYKFDIIAERFRRDKVEDDIEFAHMYKDADLLRHDLLPTEVVQLGVVHYTIDEDGESTLSEVDDIIYRRMLGRGIKQLAIALLRDPGDSTPSGFVGCVRYDYEEIDLQELKDCAVELEKVYETNEKLISGKK